MADDPEGQELVFTINVELEGLENIQAVQQRFQEMQENMNEAGEAIDETVEDTSEELKSMGDSADESAMQFSRFTGVGLGLLFTMRALNQRFTSFTDKMLEMGGITDEVGGIMAGPLAEGAMMLRKHLPLEEFREFVENNERAVAGFLILGTAVTAVGAALGMLVAFAGAAISFVGGLGVSLTALSTALTLVSGLLAVFAAGILAGIGVVKKFGPAISAAIAVIVTLIATVVSAPVVIAAAIGVIIGIFWGMRDEIIGAVKAVIGWFMDLPDKLENINIRSAAENLGSRVINGLEKGIKAGKSVILDALASILPGISGSQLAGLGSGAMSGLNSLRGNDFILSGGKMIRTNPNDAIMATKDANGFNGGGSTTNNVEVKMDADINSRMDINKVLEEMERKIDRKTRGRSRSR